MESLLLNYRASEGKIKIVHLLTRQQQITYS